MVPNKKCRVPKVHTGTCKLYTPASGPPHITGKQPTETGMPFLAD